MLAEIFMLRLEVKAREGKEAATTSSSRFVPVTLPVEGIGRVRWVRNTCSQSAPPP